MTRQILVIVALGVVTALSPASGVKAGEGVVVYTAHDRGFTEPIFKQFEAKTGIKVRAKYDTESTKTVGLVNTIRFEKDRPRCDVFWNNEIVNTICLQAEGLLAPCPTEAAKAFPAIFRDPKDHWTGFAARARVLLVNTDLVKPADEPKSIFDLTDAKWKGKVGIAKPLFGTTATHAACLFAVLGETKAKAFFAALKANDVKVEAANSNVAINVGAGRLAVGLTDTDDAINELESKRPVKIVYPDAGPDDLGTLFIPNTLALVRGAPNAANGRRLIEYLLSPEVEIALARGEAAQIPLNPAVTEKTRVKTPREVKAMPVDFAKAAEQFAAVATYLKDTFLAE